MYWLAQHCEETSTGGHQRLFLTHCRKLRATGSHVSVVSSSFGLRTVLVRCTGLRATRLRDGQGSRGTITVIAHVSRCEKALTNWSTTPISLTKRWTGHC